MRLRKRREPKVDTARALADSSVSLARATADVAAQAEQLARGRAVMRRYEKMITENNLAELVFEAFSQAYQRRPRT